MEDLKVTPAVVETAPKRNYKKELEAAQAELQSVKEENSKLHTYVDNLYKGSQELQNKLLITKNALAQAMKSLSIMGQSYELAKNSLDSVVNYLEKETK